MHALVAALALAALPPQPGARAASAPAAAPPPSVVVNFEHDLSTPRGVVPLTWPALAYDSEHGEVFVVAEGFVRIFNAAGMETHRFGDDGSLGHVEQVAVLEDGQIIALSTIDGVRAYLRCDFRGELVQRFTLSNLPPDLERFEPDRLVRKGERLYFAELGHMLVVATDLDGKWIQTYRLAPLVANAVRSDPERKPAGSMDGFNVDSAGNLLFTMSVMFAAGIATPSGQVRLFGARGSTPGRFNNVGGIDADEEGRIYVVDRLRAVVSVWSPELKHLGEFGYRGYGPSNLITPNAIAVGGGRVIVAQAAKRGVKSYRVRFVQAEVEPGAGAPPGAAPSRPPGSAGGDR
jgi:hypothetical protein